MLFRSDETWVYEGDWLTVTTGESIDINKFCSINNQGTINNNGGSISSQGTINNSGSIENKDGYISNYWGGTAGGHINNEDRKSGG